MIACGSLADLLHACRVSSPNWIPPQLQRQLIADEYYLHKKTINCHSLVGAHRNNCENKKKVNKISTEISCKFFDLLSLLALCALRTVSTCVCFATDNSKADRQQVQCVVATSRAQLRARFDSLPIDLTRLGSARLDLPRCRLMAKLVLVLFKF